MALLMVLDKSTSVPHARRSLGGGGGQLFKYSCSARLLSFEMDYFYTPGKKYIEIARGKCPDFRECIKYYSRELVTNSNSAKLGNLRAIVYETGWFLINYVYMGELRLI